MRVMVELVLTFVASTEVSHRRLAWNVANIVTSKFTAKILTRVEIRGGHPKILR